jgi:hypothetical protein
MGPRMWGGAHRAAGRCPQALLPDTRHTLLPAHPSARGQRAPSPPRQAARSLRRADSADGGGGGRRKSATALQAATAFTW